MRYIYSAAALLISLLIARPAAATILNFVVAFEPGYARSGPVPASTYSFTLDTSTAVPDQVRPYQTTYLDLDPVLVTRVSAGYATTTFSAVPVLELPPDGDGQLVFIAQPYDGFGFFSNDPNHRYLFTSDGSGISFLEGVVPVFAIQYLIQYGVATITESSTPIPEPAGLGLVVAGLAVVGFIRRRR